MCILSPNDDIPTGFEAGEALCRLIEALTARHQLGLRIHDGATSAQFPGADPEARIRRASQEIEHRWNAYQRAQCSLLTGEPYKLPITGMSVSVAMQNAVQRNDAAAAARAAAIAASASALASPALGAPV